MDWFEDSDDDEYLQAYQQFVYQPQHLNQDQEIDTRQIGSQPSEAEKVESEVSEDTPSQSITFSEQMVVCQICCKYALSAVICLNQKCSKLFCRSCYLSTKKTLQNRCPFCRVEPFQCKDSPYAKIINKMKLFCQECQQPYTLQEELNHYIKQCPYFQKVDCLYCKALLAKDQIVKHTKQQHFDKLDELIQRLYSNPEPLLKQEDVLSRREEYLKKIGKRPRIGTTGKFYCGGKLETKCSCCNGYCGPTNGENCVQCMKLDIQRLGLRKGFLLNSKGKVCWCKGDDWACGTMLYNSQQTCGQGTVCKPCRDMKRNIKRYKELI